MFKPIANFLHRTPWWALFLLGLLTLILLGAFTTPIRVIQLEKSGDSPEMNRAIQREIDSAFGESALSVAENIVKALEARSSDPARKEELQRALEEIGTAREELRDAGREVKAAAREAAQAAKEAAIEIALEAREAAKEARRGLIEAKKEAVRTMKETGVSDQNALNALKSLDDSIKEAKEAELAAQKALQDVRKGRKKDLTIDLGMGLHKDRPRLDIQIGDEAGGKAGVSISADTEGVDKKLGIPLVPDNSGGSDKTPAAVTKAPVAPTTPGVPSSAAEPSPPKVPAVPSLTPELRKQIRDKVSGDFYRIGLGAGMILLFIPLFIIAVIAKVFIDRAREAQRLAELKKKEAEFHNMNRQVTEAKLQALQAQVEPHFLYNTLANVQALTEADPPAAGQMVGHLIEYLRSALPKMRENTSTVGQEVELVRAYLNILKMRMGSRLDFAVDVPAELMALPFPPLMLPSLVENAIKHGLEPQREGGRIDIVATRAGQTLRLEVRDTGKGLGGSDISGTGVGLVNVRERLHALYGDRGRLLLEENLPVGAVAVIEIPLGAAQAAGNAAAAAASSQTPATAARASMPSRVLAGVGKVHSVWTKVLSFTFLSAVVILAVLFGIGIVGISTGWLPVHVGTTQLQGAEGMLVGSVGLLVVFGALVLVALLLVAVFYGLGVLFAALAVFIPVVILIALLPPLAPFILLGLVIYWIVRRKKRADATAAAESSSSTKGA